MTNGSAARPGHTDEGGERGPSTAVRLVVWALLSAAFTAAIIQYSLRHGRLIVPPTYDDVTYLVDGLQRLEVLHARGVPGLIAEHFRLPPHSSFSTYLALASFAVFGVRDWAPYVGNVVIVFALLAFVDHLFRGRRFVYRIAAALLALTTPVAGEAIAEFRPDMACGLFTAIGVVLLIESSFTEASTGQDRAAGACFGLALLFKPAIAPLTVALLGLSVLIAVTVRRRRERHARAASAWREVASVLWPAALLGGSPFLFDGRHYLDYFRFALFGSHKPIADYHEGLLGQLAYYVTGVGGHTLLGMHVYLFASIVVLGSAFLWFRGQRQALAPVLLEIAPLALAYAVPTLNPVKQHFFGVAFAFLLLFMALQVLVEVLRATEGDARHWGKAILALALVVGIAWAQPPLYWGETSDPRIVSRNQVAAEISGAIQALNSGSDAAVFLTGRGSLSPELLTYLALKDGRKGVRFAGLPIEEDPADLRSYMPWLNRSTFVLAIQPGDSEALAGVWGDEVQGTILDTLDARADFVSRARFPMLGGGAYVLFERIGPFFGWPRSDGILAEEGPFPALMLPVVRWGCGPQSVLFLDAAGSARRRLVLQARPIAVPLTLAVRLDGEEIGRHTFTDLHQFERAEIPFVVTPGTHRVELSYSAWDRNDALGRALLFRRLRILTDLGPNASGADAARP